MTGSYELRDSSDGQFRFVLKTDGADTLLTSELYKSKASAQIGIESVQSNSQIEARYEKKESSNGKFYFNLKAANHQIVGTSQMYASPALRDAGIELVKANGATEAVTDLTHHLRMPPAPGGEKRV